MQSIYWTSNPKVSSISINARKPIQYLASLVATDAMMVPDVEKLLGVAPYTGFIQTPNAQEQRSLLFYDSSKVGKNDTVAENLLLIGFDQSQRATDVLWQSSDPKEVEAMGAIGFAYMGRRGDQKAEVGNRIDPAKIDALLVTDPKDIADFELALGMPTSRGYKKFMNEDKLLVSSWAHQKMSFVGKQPGTSNKQKSYLTLDLALSRLMVAYRPDGEVVEVMWIKPASLESARALPASTQLGSGAP